MLHRKDEGKFSDEDFQPHSITHIMDTTESKNNDFNAPVQKKRRLLDSSTDDDGIDDDMELGNLSWTSI
jgi:hypothetical protein